MGVKSCFFASSLLLLNQPTLFDNPKIEQKGKIVRKCELMPSQMSIALFADASPSTFKLMNASPVLKLNHARQEFEISLLHGPGYPPEGEAH
jgi:hypothetical protein